MPRKKNRCPSRPGSIARSTPRRFRAQFQYALLVALGTGLLPGVCTGQQPSAIPLYDDWKLVAQSHLILKAWLIAPVDAIRHSIKSRDHSYVTLQATGVTALKGKLDSPIAAIRYHTGPTDYDPSPQRIIDLHEKEVLLFLLRSDGPAVAGLYFAGYTPGALRPVDSATVKAVLAEVQNQQRILSGFPQSLAAQPDSYHTRVKGLIDQMVDRRTEQIAFQKLERLGQAAVPSMIRLMNDRRSLPIPAISLENKSPHAFEGLRHYGPKTVVDAIVALLNQITGESFGVIYNGGSERERAASVEGWRVYLHYQQGKRP
jgi:hypothetical protein